MVSHAASTGNVYFSVQCLQLSEQTALPACHYRYTLISENAECLFVLLQSAICKNHTTTELPASCSHYGLGKSLHEAAYDAYITGHAFIIMATFLGMVMVMDKQLSMKYTDKSSKFVWDVNVLTALGV